MRVLAQQICLIAFLTVVPALGSAAAASAPSSGAHPHTVCRNCHIAADNQVSGANSVGQSAKRACIDCHANVLQPPPAAQAGLASTQSRHVFDNSLEKKIAPLGGKSFDRLDCLSCHVPHYQGQPKLLRLSNEAAPINAGGATFDPATQLCLSCHAMAADVRGFGGRGYVRHPVGIRVTRPGRLLNMAQLPPLADVKGTADPLDDVISCTTCHYPHASKNGFLLRWSMAELSSACLQCHPDVAPGETLKGLAVRR